MFPAPAWPRSERLGEVYFLGGSAVHAPSNHDGSERGLASDMAHPSEQNLEVQKCTNSLNLKGLRVLKGIITRGRPSSREFGVNYPSLHRRRLRLLDRPDEPPHYVWAKRLRPGAGS